ncbi:MAG: GNAT family N-acetyltransferase [Solirubrobacteraceae bacterium]
MTAAERPILQTPRLRGEPLAPVHERELAGLLLDPRVVRWLWHWCQPPTIGDVRAGLQDAVEHWERHGFGLWLLRDRSTGAMVGRGGLQYTDAVTGEFAVEAAWTVVPQMWGRGLATELAHGAVAVGFEQLGLTEVIAITLTDNIASRRVMEKAGFEPDQTVEHVGLEHVVHRRRRERC